MGRKTAEILDTSSCHPVFSSSSYYEGAEKEIRFHCTINGIVLLG